MTAILDLPNEVYLVALDLMAEERPTDLAKARSVLRRLEEQSDYHQPRLYDPAAGTTELVTAFGAALAMYVSLSGPFSEDGGEFAGLNGWQETKA